MPPNGPDEWRARIGHWENRKLRWYQAHCGSRPRVPLHLHLERTISEAPLLCVLLLFSLVGKVASGVCEAGNGTLSSLGKLARCCARGRRGRVLATPLLSLFLALSLLLVLAGDVETNPGPINEELLAQVDDSVLSEKETLKVYREVIGLAGRWSSMCLALGLLPSDQSTIAAAHPGNPHDCLQAVVVQWLQKGYDFEQYGPPTWRMLVEAVSDPAGGNNNALAEAIAKKHAVKAPTKPPSADPRELHHLCREFATTFTELAEILNTSVQISKLKEFLKSYCHPLHPEEHYVEPKIYGTATTTKELLEILVPQYINYMHHYLLEDIVVTFGCDRAKEVLQQYIDQKYSRKRKLNSLPGPITDGEIEQFHGTKKLKVEVKGDSNDVTVEIVGEIQKALEKATGIKRAVITYGFHDPGSVLLTFLIPETIFYIFHELNTEDLAILADRCVMKLEIDEVVIDNIQQYCAVKNRAVEVPVDSGERTKPTGLEYYLKQRATEITSERYLHLLKMLSTVETARLNDVCSEKFLATFSKDLQDWKKLAPYFSIHEWNIKELVYKYPDEDDQKYQALMCWKRAEGSTATYYNLLESLILHGNIGEVEALLQRLGEGPVVLHASRWLKQQYLAHDRWQQWRGVPNLIQFDQRLGEQTTQASEHLKNMDYSKCYYDIQDEFPSSVTPVSVKSLVNACTSSDHPRSSESCILIKGKPGQGKSFLLSKLCQYWASGYGMRSITLMFWVDCSQFKSRRMTLNQLLSQLLPIETKNISNWIENRRGKDVVFILDGYDQEQSGDLFHNLASRRFLPKSVVLIASTCTPNIRRVKQFELLNLTDNQISKQVLQFFSFTPSKVEGFYLYLTNNPDMRLLASKPVYLYTLLFVYNKLLDTPSHNLPVTWTELFTYMTLFFLQSIFPKLPQIKTTPESIHPSTVQSFLRELSTAAFENLTTESFHLTLPAAKSPRHGSGFALVHPYIKPLYHSEKQCFQFSSPLLQQFLAALHVHSLPQTKQKELMVHKSEMNFLWQFFAGLLASESYDRFLILRKTYHKKKMKMLVNCAYEADWSCDMPSVFRDHILTPADVHHIVTGSKFPPDLNFVQCRFGRETLFQLTRQVHAFAQSAQQGLRVSFEKCIFSSEELWLLAAAPFEKLRFCGLSTEDLCSLAVGLKKCRWAKGLKCLDLSYNNLTSTEAIALARALQDNKSLEELNLKGNKVGGSGATALADVLRVNQSLTTLDLKRNRIGESGGTALADALRVNQSLTTLNLGDNGIGESGAIALADALRVNQSLTTLYLERNGIGVSGATALADALRVNQSLTTLDLKRNRIRESGGTALADALRVNQSLTTLNLGWNEIRESGGTALADALRVNQTLTTLDLGRNGIGDSGATALADALRVNQSLTTLNLDGNGIGDSGATTLADALRVNQSLTTLHLGDLMITSESTEQLLGDNERIKWSNYYFDDDDYFYSDYYDDDDYF